MTRSIFFMPKQTLNWIGFWLTLVMLAWVPVLTNWLKDRYQVTGQDLIIPLLYSALTASIVALILRRRYQVDRLATTLAGVLSLLIISNSYEERLRGIYAALAAVNPIPNLLAFESPLISLVYASILLYVALGVGLWVSHLSIRRGWKIADLTNGLSVLVSVVFLLQLFPTVKTLISEWPQFSYRPVELSEHATGNVIAKPDIYYIVLDRYANQKVLSEQYGFDNSAFIEYLRSEGFSVDPNAHQNYPYTAMSIASTLNANDQTDLVQKFASASKQTIQPYYDAVRYAAVPKKLKSLGYTYTVLGNWYETSNQAPLANTLYQEEGKLVILNHTFILNNFAKDELVDSAYWRFVQLGWKIGRFEVLGYSGQVGQDTIAYQINTLHDLAAKPPGNRFIYAHILAPHEPYYYNADGSLNANSDTNNVGEPLQQKYLNQLQFINGQIKSVISEINQTSKGQSVIILQSDEGPYPTDLNGVSSIPSESELAKGSMLDWSTSDLQLKYDNLAAYHIPLASPEQIAQGGDNENVFRVVFNSYFGGTLPLLPRCYYGYVNGRSNPFKYTDITERLTGTANLNCPKNSDFQLVQK